MYRGQRSAFGCHPLWPSTFGIMLYVRVVRVGTTASSWRPEEGFQESGFLFHLVEAVSLGTAIRRTPGSVTLELPGGFSVCLPFYSRSAGFHSRGAGFHPRSARFHSRGAGFYSGVLGLHMHTIVFGFLCEFYRSN